MIPRYLLILVTLLLLAPPLAAQGQADIFLNPASPQNCEQNIFSLEMLAKAALERTKDGGVLVAIARLGDGERSREFNRRRLYNVREFLKDRAGIQAEKIVAAEGERARGLGRVEFYLSGKMVGRLLLARNKDLCLICCDEVGPYYPHKDNLEKKRTRN
jgi:hypothetical protein